MMVRPILRPIPCWRAVARITASLTGNTHPARSQARLYLGHSSMMSSRCLYGTHPVEPNHDGDRVTVGVLDHETDQVVARAVPVMTPDSEPQ
jgi:hypothetical protein